MAKFSFLGSNLILKYLHTKHNFPKHVHTDGFMIGTPICGYTRFIIEDESYDVKVGQIVVIDAYIVHSSMVMGDKEWKFVNMHIPKKTLKLIFTTFNKNVADFTFKDFIVEDKILAKRFKNLILKSLKSNTLKSDEMQCLISILLEKYANLQKNIKDIDNSKFKILFKYIKQEHYNLDRLNFHDMAKWMDMSDFYFHRNFSRAMGLTPQNFITLLKIKKATELLASKKSLSEIALECGFCDQAYFTKQFKKRHGLTPTNYKIITKIN